MQSAETSFIERLANRVGVTANAIEITVSQSNGAT
jgi:hypothetical protein